MLTNKQVDQQLREAGVPLSLRATLEREIAALANALEQDERIYHAIPGEWSARKGALFATSSRLLLASSDRASTTIESIPYDRLISIQYRSNAMGSRIAVNTAGKTFILEKTIGTMAQSLVSFAEEQALQQKWQEDSLTARIILHFVRLRRLLRSSELSPEEKQETMNLEVAGVLQALPQYPQETQQEIRAALYQLGALPDRRSGRDRRQQQTNAEAAEYAERRSGEDRRQPRNLKRWLDRS